MTDLAQMSHAFAWATLWLRGAGLQRLFPRLRA